MRLERRNCRAKMKLFATNASIVFVNQKRPFCRVKKKRMEVALFVDKMIIRVKMENHSHLLSSMSNNVTRLMIASEMHKLICRYCSNSEFSLFPYSSCKSYCYFMIKAIMAITCATSTVLMMRHFTNFFIINLNSK